MAEVVSLRHETVDGIVSLLEGKLEEARAGKIRALAIISVTHGGVIGTAWERGDSNYQHELVAGTAYLQNRLVVTASPD